jgi:hypothetical protein
MVFSPFKYGVLESVSIEPIEAPQRHSLSAIEHTIDLSSNCWRGSVGIPLRKPPAPILPDTHLALGLRGATELE